MGGTGDSVRSGYHRCPKKKKNHKGTPEKRRETKPVVWNVVFQEKKKA